MSFFFSCGFEKKTGTMATKLTPNALSQAVTKNAVTLFYAPWCPHCTELEPTYDEVARELKQRVAGLHVTKIDMAKHGDAVRDSDIGAEQFDVPVALGVKAFPTVLLFNKNGDTRKYVGARTKEAMVKTIGEFYGAAVNRAPEGGGEEDSVRFNKANCDLYMSKGFSPAVILATPTDQLLCTAAQCNLLNAENDEDREKARAQVEENCKEA